MCDDKKTRIFFAFTTALDPFLDFLSCQNLDKKGKGRVESIHGGNVRKREKSKTDMYQQHPSMCDLP